MNFEEIVGRIFIILLLLLFVSVLFLVFGLTTYVFQHPMGVSYGTRICN